jgi:hypothetical protein
MVLGFGLTVVISMFPDTPGDVAERLVPFFIALAIAMSGSSRNQGGQLPGDSDQNYTV